MYITGTSDSDGMTSGFNDIFTFKFNPESGTGVWGVYLGNLATNNEAANDIVVSPDMKSVYVVGVSDFVGLVFGATDILMVWFDAMTGKIGFMITIGGEIYDEGISLAVRDGKALMTGNS